MINYLWGFGDSKLLLAFGITRVGEEERDEVDAQVYRVWGGVSVPLIICGCCQAECLMF